LILGWLAYRSPRLSKGIGIAALLTGAFSLIMVPFMLAGQAELVGLLNLLVSLPYLVWLGWLGWHLLKHRAAADPCSRRNLWLRWGSKFEVRRKFHDKQPAVPDSV
jgi:hypothetical protein